MRSKHAGRGLVTRYSILDAAEIERFLGKLAKRFTLEVVDETGSTNYDLMLRAGQGAPSGLVRVAEMQTAGRGRRQRQWVSVPGGTLTFSLLWLFDKDANALSGLPLAAGVSVVRSLNALGLRDVQLKWPNDVLWQHRKLGGILIETTSGAGRGVTAIVGIGLNLRLPQPVVETIDQPVADLASAGLQISRNQLLARLLHDLYDVLGLFSREGFATLRAEWEQSHAYQSKMVEVDVDGEPQLVGRVIGVDADGALHLQTRNGMRVFHGGELSMRPVAT